MARDRVIVSKEEIIDKAWEMVDINGLESFSIRKIAKELKVAPMTLYNYVENSDSILKGIIIKGFNIINSNIQNKLKEEITNNNKKVSEILKIVANETFEFSIKHKEVYILMFNVDGTKFRNDPELFPLYSGALKFMKELFDENYISNISNQIYMYEIFLNGLIVERLKNRVDMSKEKFNELIEFCLDKFFN